MLDQTFESILGAQLREYAERGVAPSDPRAIATELIERRGASGSGTGRLRGVPPAVRWLGIAALLLLGLLAGLVLSQLGDDPSLLVDATPSPTAVAVLTPTPEGTEPATATGPYEVIWIRDAAAGPPAQEVVATTLDGRERVIRRIEGEFVPWPVLSADGWLALSARPTEGEDRGTWHLLDLGDPSRPAWIVPANPELSAAAWGPDGRFATLAPDELSVVVVDATDGSMVEIGPEGLTGAGPGIEWAADGSGIVIEAGSGRSVRHLDGSTTGGYPTPGLRVDFCRDLPDECDGAYPFGHAIVRPIDGTGETWYDGELRPAKLQHPVLSDDGTHLWLLLHRVDGDQHFADIARLDAPHAAVVVATVEVRPDVVGMAFAGWSADESTFIVEILAGPSIEPTGGGYAIVDTAGHAAHLGVVYVLGLTPAAVADAWPGGSFAPIQTTD
ncbi:MAG TPA: hypothetical protein VFX65_13210 [Candidatus Limnocylindrales bacterium]|nr:hypothetical protein [Candidatus Limnocylindrales bacterium]